MPKLNTNIYVKGKNQQGWFGPDDELPDWAIVQLKEDGTPGIWEDEPEGTENPQYGVSAQELEDL
jgi:hypothetical protein